MNEPRSRSVPDISVILLTRDAGERFREVLDGLFACRGIERSEVLVLDSGSADATLKIAASRPGVRIHRIRPEEFGHGRTRNLGARLAQGNTLVFLVQDATPTSPDVLEYLVAPLSADPEVAATYGRQVPRPEADPVESEFLRTTYPDRLAVRDLRSRRGPITISSIFFSNVCSAVRRTVWERFPFDEEMIMSEDQQWAREVLTAGYRIVYEPRAVVLHSHGYGLKRVFQRNFDSGYSLRSVTQDSLARMVCYEARFVRDAARHLWRTRRARSIPRLFMHEAARSLGFLLGKKGHWLAPRLCRACSLHEAYWDRKSGS